MFISSLNWLNLWQGTFYNANTKYVIKIKLSHSLYVIRKIKQSCFAIIILTYAVVWRKVLNKNTKANGYYFISYIKGLKWSMVLSKDIGGRFLSRRHR